MAGHRLGALEVGGGGNLPPFQCIPAVPHPHPPWGWGWELRALWEGYPGVAGQARASDVRPGPSRPKSPKSRCSTATDTGPQRRCPTHPHNRLSARPREPQGRCSAAADGRVGRRSPKAAAPRGHTLIDMARSRGTQSRCPMNSLQPIPPVIV